MPTLRSKSIRGAGPGSKKIRGPRWPEPARGRRPRKRVPKSQQSQRLAGAVKHLKATQGNQVPARAQCHCKAADGCLTDPEPGMDSGRATVRNMRSKCRCSCVLQFTFRRAVSCVLHRPPSQVIHCTVLFSFIHVVSPRGRSASKEGNTQFNSQTSHHGEGLKK